MKAVSFDLWGTLIVSNPEFKVKQGELVKEFTGKDCKTFTENKNKAKKEIDNLVESQGIHPDRSRYYKTLLPQLSWREIDEFIQYSDRLFLEYRPQKREPETDIVQILRDKDIKSYISSNTVFIYGNVLKEVIYDYFKIIKTNCKFSDELGYSKPDKCMFDFPIKPLFHIGDNIITDGASEKYGIKHYHINDKQNFKTFLKEHGNI